jgi:hypothetical protein
VGGAAQTNIIIKLGGGMLPFQPPIVENIDFAS